MYGIYGAESNFGQNPSTSGAGAQGPWQFIPSTARSLGINPNNFTSATFGAAKYLSQFKGRGTRGMIGAYNAGPGGTLTNPETAAYIPKVLSLAKGWGPLWTRISRAANAGKTPAQRQTAAPAGAAGTPERTIVTGSTAVTPGGTPKADELAAQQQVQPGQVPVTAPPEPAYSASRFMAPVGGPLKLTPPLAGGVTPPSTPSLDQQLADVGKQQGPDLGALTTQTIPGTPGVGGGAAPRRGGGAGYGHRYFFPIQGSHYTTGRTDNGVDYETRPGTPLLAVGSGVVQTWHGPFTGPGSLVIKLDRPVNGFGYVYYGHLNDSNKKARPGQRVVAGQVVATSSHSPPGAEDLPGHVEIGFSRSDGSIQLRGHAEGSTEWGRIFSRFIGRQARR